MQRRREAVIGDIGIVISNLKLDKHDEELVKVVVKNAFFRTKNGIKRCPSNAYRAKQKSTELRV